MMDTRNDYYYIQPDGWGDLALWRSRPDHAGDSVVMRQIDCPDAWDLFVVGQYDVVT